MKLAGSSGEHGAAQLGVSVRNLMRSCARIETPRSALTLARRWHRPCPCEESQIAQGSQPDCSTWRRRRQGMTDNVYELRVRNQQIPMPARPARTRAVLAAAGLLFFVVLGIGGWELQSLAAARAQGQASALGDADSAPQSPSAAVTALGRIEPKGGLLRIAGPARPVLVISQLSVAEGDTVYPGQVLAVLDGFAAQDAVVARLRAELHNAETEYQRYEKLHRGGIVSASERDTWRLRVDVTRAELKGAQAELESTLVRAPIKGRVLNISAHPGERVGPEGIACLGYTDQMDVRAEIYETDINRVRIGQRATITSKVLSEPLQGTVERIGLQVGKLDVLNDDPAATTDARVVDVHIRLDDSQRVAGLTNLQVEVGIAL